MAAVISRTSNTCMCASLTCLEVIWVHGCCHLAHIQQMHMCFAYMLGTHLAAWLLSLCSHPTHAYVLCLHAWRNSSGCMSAVTLRTSNICIYDLLTLLELIWLHGCCLFAQKPKKQMILMKSEILTAAESTLFSPKRGFDFQAG